MEIEDTNPVHTTRVYDVLADLFIQQGVSTCFALLGDANMYWAAALSSRGVNFVYVRDEHCAVAAAMSYARSSGKTGIATVTCGPGLTQILTALPAAARASIPLVVFAGEAPMKNSWYNQAIDQRPFVEACGVEYLQLREQSQLSRVVEQAFHTAKTGSSPVVIGVPMDFQEMSYVDGYDSAADSMTDDRSSSHASITGKTRNSLNPDPFNEKSKTQALKEPVDGELENALKLLSTTQRPVLVAGLGAVAAEAGPACQLLAELTGALLATTLPARGLFYDEPYCVGVAGGFSPDVARQFLSEADLIIAVGTRLTRHTTDQGKLWAAEHVLHIDLEPLEESQGLSAAHHHVQGDARAIVERLCQLLESASSHQQQDVPGDGATAVVVQKIERDKQWRSQTTARQIASQAADQYHYEAEPGLLDPRAVIDRLNQILPVDCHTVNSSGHCSWFAAQMPGRQASHFFTLREFGAIGNGLAFAMGVAVAHPDRRVVLFDGDGSFLMHVQELETIVRHQLNILVCVLNDGGYGSEIHKLRAHGKSEEGAFFGYTDLSAISSGFGLPALVIDELDSLETAWQDLESRGRCAAVWDIRISNQVVSPVIRRSQGINP